MTHELYPESTEPVLIHDGTDYYAYYTTYLLPDGPMVMFHLETFYFSPSVYRDMLEKWRLFRSIYKNPIFCHLDEERGSVLKLVDRVGFKPIGTTPCSDGKTRTVFVHYSD
jgi:hypothetical protein